MAKANTEEILRGVVEKLPVSPTKLNTIHLHMYCGRSNIPCYFSHRATLVYTFNLMEEVLRDLNSWFFLTLCVPSRQKDVPWRMTPSVFLNMKRIHSCQSLAGTTFELELQILFYCLLMFFFECSVQSRKKGPQKGSKWFAKRNKFSCMTSSFVSFTFCISVPYLSYAAAIEKNHLPGIRLQPTRGNHSSKKLQNCPTLLTLAH